MIALVILAAVLGLGMVAAATWLVGFWNNVITWVNLLLAALVATSFFEPLADRLNQSAPESGYLVDFVAVWGLFFATFLVLRIATEVLSKHRLKFDVWTETVGRSVMSILIALTLFGFTSFTLHTAPLPIYGFWGENFQPTPEARALGIGADRSWMNAVRSMSVGSLAEFRESRLWPPYDLASNSAAREFDPAQEFILKYRQRRRVLSEQESLQVVE